MQIISPTRFEETPQQMEVFIENNYQTILEIKKLANHLVYSLNSLNTDEIEMADSCYKTAKELIRGFEDDVIPISQKLNKPRYKLSDIVEEHKGCLIDNPNTTDQLADLANSPISHHLRNQMIGICGYSKLVQKKTKDPSVKLIATKISGLCSKLEKANREFSSNIKKSLENDPLRTIQ